MTMMRIKPLIFALRELCNIAGTALCLGCAFMYYILISIQAASIDDSDVTLWYKIGKLAIKLGNLRLARYSFEQVSIIFNY
jgi:hypothetical protein